jgi:hypothetical protein
LIGLVGRSLGTSENLNSYAGSVSGIIYYLNENGSCMEVLQADGAVKYLLHYQQNDRIIVITESMVIGQFQVEVVKMQMYSIYLVHFSVKWDAMKVWKCNK